MKTHEHAAEYTRTPLSTTEMTSSLMNNGRARTPHRRRHSIPDRWCAARALHRPAHRARKPLCRLWLGNMAPRRALTLFPMPVQTAARRPPAPHASPTRPRPGTHPRWRPLGHPRAARISPPPPGGARHTRHRESRPPPAQRCRFQPVAPPREPCWSVRLPDAPSTVSLSLATHMVAPPEVQSHTRGGLP